MPIGSVGRDMTIAGLLNTPGVGFPECRVRRPAPSTLPKRGGVHREPGVSTLPRAPAERGSAEGARPAGPGQVGAEELVDPGRLPAGGSFLVRKGRLASSTSTRPDNGLRSGSTIAERGKRGEQPGTPVRTGPRRLLQLQRRGPVGTGRHQTGGPQPDGRWQRAGVQHRSGPHRRLPATPEAVGLNTGTGARCTSGYRNIDRARGSSPGVLPITRRSRRALPRHTDI